MKKSLVRLAAPILGVLAALAAPVTAQAHRAWLAPTSTVLSGDSAWVGFDAGMSNGVFIPDHAAMNLAGLVITAPDGSTVQPENLHRARYRSTFDLHLTQPGTYKVSNVTGGIMASYRENGEEKRWRGQAAEFPGALPAGATDVVATRTSNRIETFVTLGAPTDGVFADPAEGLAMIPVTHPNDLVAGEPGWTADEFKRIGIGAATLPQTLPETYLLEAARTTQLQGTGVEWATARSPQELHQWGQVIDADRSYRTWLNTRDVFAPQ